MICMLHKFSGLVLFELGEIFVMFLPLPLIFGGEEKDSTRVFKMATIVEQK